MLVRSHVDWLDAFYREHRQALFTCALAVTRSPEQAEDAIQEAFFRLYRLHGSTANGKAYIWRAVRNAAIDQLRRNPRHEDVDGVSILDPSPDPAERAETGEFQRRVAVALADLPENEREAIAMHLYAGLTFREIAEVREVPLGTVTSWYRRGLDVLRERLAADAKEVTGNG
jgi:RNA polymerase sigma-70 factor, ECF subfamily